MEGYNLIDQALVKSVSIMPVITIQNTQWKHLWLKTHWSDLHLHFLEGVVGPVPTIPSDPICVPCVLPVAVENPIQVGVGATVVPIATWNW